MALCPGNQSSNFDDSEQSLMKRSRFITNTEGGVRLATHCRTFSRADQVCQFPDRHLRIEKRRNRNRNRNLHVIGFLQEH